MNELLQNGGFPEPQEGLAVRLLRTRHPECGTETRVRVPGVVPAHAVRRVVCSGCAERFDAPEVEEIEEAEPSPAAEESGPPIGTEPAESVEAEQPSDRRGAFDPRGRLLRLVAVPIAAAAVIGGVALVQKLDEPQPGDPSPRGPATAETRSGARAGSGGKGSATASSSAGKFLRESTFSLVLPRGWKRTEPASGAAFAARAPEGAADATLWIEEDSNLSMGDFETRSIEQLAGLAGTAPTVQRSGGPTAETTQVLLRAGAPEDGPIYEVLLRASGPYRYYLATTLNPDAPSSVADAVALIQGSLTPETGGGGRAGRNGA